MAEVTTLKSRGGKVEVCIDNTLSFSVSVEVASRLNLSMGRSLTDDELQELLEVEAVERCLTAAFRLLSYRPRSRAELRQRLLGRGFSEIVVDRVLALLGQRGLVDDVAFAHYWADNRARFKPRSARLIGLELRRKGVGPEVVGEVIQSLDEEVLAYEAGLKKVRALARLSEEEFCQRLYDHLHRRGFADEVIRPVLERLRDRYAADERAAADFRRGE